MSYEEINRAKQGTEEDLRQLQGAVNSILQKVKEKGDGDAMYYGKEFDNFKPTSFSVSLKFLGGPPPCRFNSGPRHQIL
jgi:histidinol dehydrogenase